MHAGDAVHSVTKQQTKLTANYNYVSREDELLEIDKGCRQASIGCIDCKKVLFKNMMDELIPIRDRADSLKKDRDYVIDVVRKGAKTCSEIAKKTMEEVRSSLGIFYP